MSWDQFLRMKKFRAGNVHIRGQPLTRWVSGELAVTKFTPRASTSREFPITIPSTTEMSSREYLYKNVKSSTSDPNEDVFPKSIIHTRAAIESEKGKMKKTKDKKGKAKMKKFLKEIPSHKKWKAINEEPPTTTDHSENTAKSSKTKKTMEKTP